MVSGVCLCYEMFMFKQKRKVCGTILWRNLKFRGGNICNCRSLWLWFSTVSLKKKNFFCCWCDYSNRPSAQGNKSLTGEIRPWLLVPVCSKQTQGWEMLCLPADFESSNNPDHTLHTETCAFHAWQSIWQSCSLSMTHGQQQIFLSPAPGGSLSSFGGFP